MLPRSMYHFPAALNRLSTTAAVRKQIQRVVAKATFIETFISGSMSSYFRDRRHRHNASPLRPASSSKFQLRLSVKTSRVELIRTSRTQDRAYRPADRRYTTVAISCAPLAVATAPASHHHDVSRLAASRQ